MSDTEENESLVMHPEAHASHHYYSSDSGFDTSRICAEERMRRKLKFFFMNPIEKWQTKQRFPYKFLVQVFKIILVTIQLCLFAHSRYNHVNYSWDSRVSFSHLFLKGWDTAREVNAYPPSMGPLALYNKQDFYDTIDFAVISYANLSDAIGPYSYADEDNNMIPPLLCFYHYKEGRIFGFNESYVFDSEITEMCINITVEENFSSKEFLESRNIIVNFSALVRTTLEYSIKTVNFKAAGPITPPDCYKFNIIILFNNEDMDGQMVVSLDAEPIRLVCKGDVEYINDNRLDYILRSVLNGSVILICAVSFVLCSRAIFKAQQLKFETIRFFKEAYDKDLSVEGRFEFWNLWYIMIIVNDVLLIIGSAMKEEIERKQFIGDQWNTCSVFLGTGNLLVWFGVLRYLGFFKTYNVVILTLKKAFPKVARFLLCAVLIYAGFTFCGWLVLGPYHMKFRSLATTSECLFSLINGDDMFATFSMMSFKSSMLWWFSRIYLYSFISLYIYVVLSLFISVIMDAYETIKLYYKEGFPKTDVQIFIAASTDDVSNGSYSSSSYDAQTKISLQEIVNKLCCCKMSWITALFQLGNCCKKKSVSSEFNGAICI